MNHRLLRPRASGGAFDPRSISGLAGWWDAADATSVTLNGSSVSQLNDKSGSGFHATQTSAANQPAYVTSAINGRNVVRFTSTSNLHRLLLTGPALTNENTWVLVATTSSVGGYIVSADGTGNAGPSLISNFGQAYEFFWGNLNRATIASSASGANILSADFANLGNLRTYYNGSPAGSIAALTVSFSGLSLARIGNAINNNGGFGGDFCEFLHYNRVLGNGERLAVEQYLSHKWGKSLA